MKTVYKLLGVVVLSAVVSVGLRAQDITGFGSGDFTLTFSDFSSSNQNADFYMVSGSDIGSFFVGSFDPVMIGTPSVLTLTAIVTSQPSSVFSIELYDLSDNSIVYEANWSDFVLNASSVSEMQFVSNNGFNGTAVRLALATGGDGAALSVTFDNLSAIPEPATWAAMLGGVALFMVVGRRRRRTAV